MTNFISRSVVVAGLITLSLQAKVAFADRVFLESINNNQTPYGLIIVPGANVTPEQYKDLGEAIQNKFSGSLSVIIPQFPGNFPNPLQVEGKISESIRDLEAISGKISRKNIFVAGHSLGGIMAYKSAAKLDVGGLILLGSYLPKSSIAGYADLAEFPIPTLTLGGEKDGLTGLNYIEREFSTVLPTYKDKANKLRKPVVLLDGVTHSHFADGYGAKNDLPTALSLEDAHSKISTVISDFIAINGDNSSNAQKARLLKAIDKTIDYFAPFTKARIVEQTVCEQTQMAIAQAPVGFWKENSIEVSYHQNDLIISSMRPKFKNNGEKTSVQVRAKKYFPTNLMDVSENMNLAPNHVVCKVKSRAAFEDSFSFEPSQSQSHCQDIMKTWIKDAEQSFSPKQLADIKARNVKLVSGSDLEFTNGPTWFISPMKYETQSHETVVRSPTVETSMNAMGEFGGVKYCKLITPLKIVEWYLHSSRLEK